MAQSGIRQDTGHLAAVGADTFTDKARVSLRKFPYPFRAALAICNDIDGTKTIEEMLQIQRFLNTKQNTLMGKGLGLDIANSFFFYDNQGDLSYFGGDARVRRIIVELIQAGCIDSLHSFGNGCCKRDEIERAFEELDANNCRLDVWINHFGAPSNLSSKFESELGICQGDDPRSSAYHTDLTLQYGVRFAWVGYGTRMIGQSRVGGFVGSLPLLVDTEHLSWSLICMLKEARKAVLGRTGDERYRGHSLNQLTRPMRLRDGRKMHEFVRYCSHPAGIPYGATSRGLSYLISKRNLELLEAGHGYMIVYTHLGKNKDCAEVVAPETQAALRALEVEHRGGRLYVTTTSWLLNYHNVWKYLKWSYAESGGRVRIRIDSIADPIFGESTPSVNQLQGLCFLVQDSQRAEIFVGDKEIRSIQRNPADDSGRASVSIPARHLDYPY